MEVFGQDPQIHLHDLRIRVPSVVEPSRWVDPDSTLCTRVNWEIYFSSDATEKARFDAAPWSWCGLLTDPVSMRRFHPLSTSPQRQHAGRLYYFESPETAARFAAAPDSFAVRRGM